MEPTFAARTLTVSIRRSPQDVYQFVSDPANLPRWATAFCRAVRRSGDGWIVETPDGPVTLRFVDENTYGVLDHRVIVAGGEELLVPMRVVPNASGSEVLFTLYQQPGMSAEEFDDDTALVQRDLETLRRVLENG